MQKVFTKCYTNVPTALQNQKWTPKEAIILDIPVQEFDYGDIAVYKDYSRLTGFTLYYLVDGEWSRKEPSNVGSYDIKITRDEDPDYASFEQVYSKVLVIKPVQRDFSILIFIFYFFSFFFILFHYSPRTCLVTRKKTAKAVFFL